MLWPCVRLCLSVSVSVTSRCSTKTATHKITQTKPHDSSGTLVFWCQRSLRNSTRVTPSGGVKCRRGGLKSATFDKQLAIRSSAIAEGPRDASCQLKSCQLPRNSVETTCTTSPEQIEIMNLEDYSGPMCNKHLHSTMTRSSRFHCSIGVINKRTTDELWISPVYRRLAVAKFF